MARAEYVDYAVNGEGRPTAGAKVLIKVHAGAAGENILWAGETGTGRVSELKSGKNGLFSVWLAEGRYDVSIPHFQITKTIDVINQASVGAGGGGEIADGSVTEAKLATNSVSTVKLQPGAVTKEKLSTSLQEEIEAGGGTGEPTGPAGGDLSGSYPNPTIGAEKVVTASVKTAAITKEKLSTPLQTEIEAKSGTVTVKEFVDINGFFNVLGEKKGITAAEASELPGGKRRDSAPIIQEALTKAASFPHGQGAVSCSEPGTYYLESTRLSPNLSGIKPYTHLKPAYGYESANFQACLHVPAGVVLGGPMGNASALQLEVGKQVWEKCVEEREKGAVFPCVAIATEPTNAPNKLVLGAFTLGCSASLENYTNLKTPPPLPDGIYQACSGRFEGVQFAPNSGFRYGLVVGANHYKWTNFAPSGWAKIAFTDWGSQPGGIVGNSEFLRPVLNGSFCLFYAEPECSISSIRITEGYFGFNTKGPFFYKPTTKKPNFIQGLHITNSQFELGRGPLFYNEDAKGAISKVWINEIQAGGSDPPMGSPGVNGDLAVGYRPSIPLYGAGLDAYIKAGSISEVHVRGALIPEVGWGPEAAAVIASEEIRECDFGDLTVAINACRYRGLPVLSAPVQFDNQGIYQNSKRQVSKVSFAYANAAIEEGELVRMGEATESKNPLAIKRFDKKEGVIGGVAVLPAASHTIATYLRKDSTRPSVLRMLVANLGYAQGESGNIPPPARGGKIKFSAAFVNGAGTGSEHSPVNLYGVDQFRGAIYVTPNDLPSSGVVSFGEGTIIAYRQKISRGSKVEPKAKIKTGSVEAKLTVASITGLSSGLAVTGTGIPRGTQVEIVDGTNFILILSQPATKEEEVTLTVEAPVDILEGTLFGSASRCTTAIDPATLTGTGTIKVVTTEGMGSTGSIQVKPTPWARKSATTWTVEYTSKTSTELKGCKITKSATTVAPIGSVVVPIGTSRLGAHARLYRAAEITPPTPASSAYEGTERLTSASSELEVVSGTAFATAGSGQIETITTLPSAQEWTKGVTKVITVSDTKTFPIKGPKEIAGEVIGRLEVGTNCVADLMGVKSSTELEVEFKKLSPGNKKRLAGEEVKMNPIAILWTGKTGKKLTGVTASNSSAHMIRAGMPVTASAVTTGGGVLEGENEASAMQKMAYRGLTTAKGKTYVHGLVTPSTGGIASGKELTDLTVLPVEGSGFPTGPGGAICSAANNVAFTYTAFLNAAGAEGSAGEEEEEGGEEEGGEEEEAANVSLIKGFFVGVGNVLKNGKSGEGGASGIYTGATTLTEELKTTETYTKVKVTSTVNYPSTGIVSAGPDEVTYTAIANSTEFTVNSYKPTENILTGLALPLTPGKQAKADETLRAAYESGREANGDKGVVRVGGSGERVGVAVEADISGTVLGTF